jgi:hypothetical protein
MVTNMFKTTSDHKPSQSYSLFFYFKNHTIRSFSLVLIKGFTTEMYFQFRITFNLSFNANFDLNFIALATNFEVIHSHF